MNRERIAEIARQAVRDVIAEFAGGRVPDATYQLMLASAKRAASNAVALALLEERESE